MAFARQAKTAAKLAAFFVARTQTTRSSLSSCGGFTLIELVMVILLIGILAVFVGPRFDERIFAARGFHDETLALMRYAQKTAIAQRRTVCVAFAADSATLSIAPAAATNTCTGALVGPRGEPAGNITAPAGVAYQAVPGAAFFFNPLGQPSQALALQVTQAGVAIGMTVTVEAETGYVHD
ncbi:MAG: type II secretion system protein [Hylemonella sp.]|nr:type II secretion system protein [Hylemonella sp.]